MVFLQKGLLTHPLDGLGRYSLFLHLIVFILNVKLKRASFSCPAEWKT